VKDPARKEDPSAGDRHSTQYDKVDVSYDKFPDGIGDRSQHGSDHQTLYQDFQSQTEYARQDNPRAPSPGIRLSDLKLNDRGENEEIRQQLQCYSQRI